MASYAASHDVLTLLSSEDQDFLVRNNGDQVKIGNLTGKCLGLYFSGSWCGPCRQFTPSLIEVYEDLLPKCDFEVVFISSDRDEESFNGYFSKMPWLAVPFSDSAAIKGLQDLFQVRSFPSLVILDGSGKVLSDQGEEEAAKKNQSLSSLLVSKSRDYLISTNGDKVPVSNLEGKLVGLYFSVHSHKPCVEFTQKLVEVCRKLKEKGENNFEVVSVSLDDKEEDFRQGFESKPFLALPFKDGTLAELAEIEKAKLEAQTLESVLVLEEQDFVIDKSGSKIPVSELVGKNILLYFSAHWCPPCRAFLPKLISAYHEIKAMDKAFEVIFISSDRDQSSFDKYFSEMPWLALPLGDPRKTFLVRKFKVRGIPAVIALGPSGRTLNTEARHLIAAHGAEAYPFTEEHLQKLKERLEKMAKGWPEKIKHELHPLHDLTKSLRGEYICDGCKNMGKGFSYHCKICDFDLHPKCCLKIDEGLKNDDKGEPGKEGWTCDGEVCRKA
ncbi:hypothetical protein CRG98_036961 [Punica granatum]|uniref:protein-disulfide reductase n=1 Tax=Punica granatum TaxID=22663 RepID=A0A2I0IFB4_PUNGR|nr:hypothetical protein CRG98_036961 [Punica granatum]